MLFNFSEVTMKYSTSRKILTQGLLNNLCVGVLTFYYKILWCFYYLSESAVFEATSLVTLIQRYFPYKLQFVMFKSKEQDHRQAP